MSRVVFLLEEYSMKVLLEGLLPRLLPQLRFVCVAHEGKQDLEKSIPRKLRAWREPGVRFVVIRDNDGADCAALKRRLVDLCADGKRPDSLVRIACQELDAWYFGDTPALATAFGEAKLRSISARAKYRDPDSIIQPAKVLAKLVKQFQKVGGARRMAKTMSQENQSRSFQVLMSGLATVANEVPTAGRGGVA